MQLPAQLKISRWLLGVGVSFTAAAMLTYPGGNGHDPTAPHYSFLRNSLSDLGAQTAWNGQSNALTALLFAAGFLLVAAAGGSCVVALSRLYTCLGAPSWFQVILAVTAAVACSGFAAIAFLPEDSHPLAHRHLVTVAAVVLVALTLLLARSAARAQPPLWTARIAWWSLALLITVWFTIRARHPVTTREMIIAVGAQKLLAIGLVAVALLQMSLGERALRAHLQPNKRCN